MIGLLASIFIKDHKNYTDAKVRTAYGYLCGSVGIFINIVLFGIKLAAGIISSSVAIMADAFNNLSDAGSSVMSIIGFRLASQKPDPEHPFGHGRFEYIASLIISFVIIFMGLELAADSFGKIMNPVEVEYSAATVAVLIISVAAKIYMFIYNRAVGKKIESATLSATATDSISDTFSTVAILVSALISMKFGIITDGWMGLLVSAIIVFAGISGAKDTVDALLGKPATEEFYKKVGDIVLSHEGIIGIHDMIVHNYGPGRVFISLHAEVPSDGNFVEIHDTIDNIEHDILRELGCLATIHMDPVDIHSEMIANIREKVAAIIEETDPVISFHDFRIVTGPTHTNVIFDIVLPYNYRLGDEAAAKLIADKIHEWDNNYYAVIDVDKDFISHEHR